jgi:hypothetical protein
MALGVLLLQWSGVRWARVVARNVVSCDQRVKVPEKRVSKRAGPYLSREEK